MTHPLDQKAVEAAIDKFQETLFGFGDDEVSPAIEAEGRSTKEGIETCR